MKSHVSDLLEVAECVFKDTAAKCAAYSSFDRDLKTIRSRVREEGISFLTITLPTLGSDLETCLKAECIVPGVFRSFRKRLKVPAFMQGYFAQIFDVNTGGILNEPSIEAVESIRQVANTFKKIRLECTPTRVRAALRQFEQIEHDLQKPLAPSDLDDFVKVSDCLWSTVFSGEINPLDTVPKHGPGATAESIHGNMKYSIRSWHDRLEPYFPLYSFAFSSESALGSWEAGVAKVVKPEEEPPVRVITVPKTLKTPRIIAIEPVCMQYTQQAISRVIVDTLETVEPTKGHINFTCQSVNRTLALSSSSDSRYATIDMSAASDRVPLSVAMRMFDKLPDLQGAIFACRSRDAKLPTGKLLRLRKFASMGSALCFPIEAMYFYTICVAARLKLHNLSVTFSNIRKVAKDVFVYGDDILVPTNEAETIADHLHKYYCKVNMSKSFWSGNFRESCGMDAYRGEEVTPTYLRSTPPGNRQDSKALISWVETSNLFYRKGYWNTASHLIKRCETILGVLPLVGPKCAGLGKVSYQPYVSTERYNRKYQVHEVKTWVASPVYRTDKLGGYSALSKCLIKQPGPPDPDVDVKHLDRTARHGAVTLKRRWTRPY